MYNSILHTNTIQGTNIIIPITNNNNNLTIFFDWCISNPCGLYGICNSTSSTCTCINGWSDLLCSQANQPIILSISPLIGPPPPINITIKKTLFLNFGYL